MSLKLQHVTFDCAAPRRLAEFWAEAMGGVIADDWGEFVTVSAPKMPDFVISPSAAYRRPKRSRTECISTSSPTTEGPKWLASEVSAHAS
jgi:hypothetical protein